MAIEKQTLYTSSSNLNNAADNVINNYFGDDKIKIEVDYDSSPAIVTVKNGSMFNYNDYRFLVSGDETFQMSLDSHNYITFNGNNFNSSSSIGLFDATKNGFYNNDNRILKFYIDQVGKSHFDLIDLKTNFTITTKRFDRMRYGRSSLNGIGRVYFNNIIFDELLSYDTVNSIFTVLESGYYIINVNVSPSSGGFSHAQIRKNGSSIAKISSRIGNAISTASTIEYLIKNDVIDVYTFFEISTPSNSTTYFEAIRLL